mmetsp:Transcript_10357/g.30743  ORF Transcript_10357/g.30743 Transcript_10357/m.30743 type:complete len:176 (-) Transcript_10357:197-724(-)
MEPELKDWQQLSDLNQVSEGLSESLRMTAKVRVMVTIRDSAGSDVKVAARFEADADTTTIFAVKEEVVHVLGLVDVGFGTKIQAGRMHVFRIEDGHMSAEWEDSQVLAHYGAGIDDYDEILLCVIDQPLSMTAGPFVSMGKPTVECGPGRHHMPLHVEDAEYPIAVCFTGSASVL